MKNMEWTTDLPKRSGVYWVRDHIRRYKLPDIIGEPELVRVRLGQHSELHYIESERIAGFHQLDSVEWYGPLEPPE